MIYSPQRLSSSSSDSRPVFTVMNRRDLTWQLEVAIPVDNNAKEFRLGFLQVQGFVKSLASGLEGVTLTHTPLTHGSPVSEGSSATAVIHCLRATGRHV